MNRKGMETRQHIKTKACQLFAKKGFKEVTMKDICEATGLSRGGLYCHYDSTVRIFDEILNDFMDTQDEEFRSKMQEGMSAVEILDDVLDRYRAEMIDREASLSVAIFEYFSGRGNACGENPLYQQYLSSRRMWEELIQYGIDRKEFYQVDKTAVFDLIVFSYQGVRLYSRIMTITEDIPLRIMSQIRKILVRRKG